MIDEALCIGCTLCIQACPVDCIVGAPTKMHTVIESQCTGCDLCLPPCPMDCIAMVPVQPPRAWTRADAEAARRRYAERNARRATEQDRNERRLAEKAVAKLAELDARDDLTAEQVARRKSVVEAALARARARRAASTPAHAIRIRMNPAKRRAIYETLRELNPHPTTELEFSTPFELLVAVVLSAQATDKSVNAATRVLYKVANTPAAIVAAGRGAARPSTSRRSASSAPRRSNVIGLSRLLLEQHGGEVPREREALEALPGVGRKTANVVLNTAFGQPTIAVDTHIFRVSNRTNLAPGDTVDEVEARLAKFTPDEFRKDAHHWLILHGRYICKARTPECWRCPIAAWCEYKPKTPAPRAPARLLPGPSAADD